MQPEEEGAHPGDDQGEELGADVVGGEAPATDQVTPQALAPTTREAVNSRLILRTILR